MTLLPLAGRKLETTDFTNRKAICKYCPALIGWWTVACHSFLCSETWSVEYNSEVEVALGSNY